MTEKVLLTKDGVEKLKIELDTLINTVRVEVTEEIRDARAQGDLSENADYDAARNRQAQVESRIKDIQDMLDSYELIDDRINTKTVKPGVSVKIRDLSDNSEHIYTIVGHVETDPVNGKISNESPLAQALMNHSVGTKVTVRVKNPYVAEILDILRR